MSNVFASLTRGASFAKSKNHKINTNIFKGDNEQSKNTTIDFKTLTSVTENVSSKKSEDRADDALELAGTDSSEDKDLNMEGTDESESDNDTHDKKMKTKTNHISKKYGVFKSQDKVNEFRNALQIRIRNGNASDAPPPCPTFDSMSIHKGIKQVILDNIEESLWKEPTPIQMQAIPTLLAGKDVLAAAPTGSGKTAAFVIPVLSIVSETLQELQSSEGTDPGKGVRALLLAPTRELAEQIHREATRLCAGRRLRICLLRKATNSSSQAKQDKSAYASYDILVSTPLRLVSLIRAGSLGLEHVKIVVLDEADKLFELKKHGRRSDGDEEDDEEEQDGEGQGTRTRSSFLAQVDEILAACPQKHVRRALFSATIGSFVAELASQFLRNPIHVAIGTENTGASTIDQKLVFVGREDGKLLAIQQLIQQGLKPPVLLFVQSIERAKELFQELAYDGINVDVIHAEKSQSSREETIRKFRTGEVWVLICTELMARGVDFKGVQMVINYDMPQSSVDYIHRIGRTGRAGRRGTAVTLFTEADIPKLRAIANVVKLSGCEVPDWMLTIPKLTTKQKRHLRQAAPVRRRIDTSVEARKRKADIVAAAETSNKGKKRAAHTSSTADQRTQERRSKKQKTQH